MGEIPKRKTKRAIEIDDMIKLYQDGSSTTEIAKLANVSSRYVRRVLSDQGIEKRPFGNWKRQYTVNQHYFKHWSPNMAYILGFFAADGFISNDNQMISFAQKEKGILEDIRMEIKSNHPLVQNPKTGVYSLNIGSKIMKDDLMNIHGITPHKSLDIKFPHVPDKHLIHFIRGYFDGDGNINYEKRSVSFVGGSYEFMEKLSFTLQKNGFNPYLKKFKENYYRVYITGRRTIYLFAQWIYTDKTLYLDRKFESFQLETLDLSQLSDRKIKRTRAAVIERKCKFVQLYREKKSLIQICEVIGIQQITAKNWLKNDKELQKELNSIGEKSSNDHKS